MNTVLWQRIEGAAVFVATLVLFGVMDGGIGWWLAVLVFFAPDLSFAAYAFGSRVGAVAYNLVHVYAFGAVLLALGVAGGMDQVAALGLLWMSHSGFDRMFGYGLKSEKGFSFTHLGPIGGARAKP